MKTIDQQRASALRRRTIERWRTETVDGRAIALHRALRRPAFPHRRWVSVLILPALASMVLAGLVSSRSLTRFWAMALEWSLQITGTQGAVLQSGPASAARIGLAKVSLDLTAGAPSLVQWAGCAIVTFCIALGSTWLSGRFVPAAYLLRMLAIVVGASLLWFALRPNEFGHSLMDHVSSMFDVHLVLTGLVPWIFALTYNVFAFAWWQKLALTGLGMGFVLVSAPLLAFSHALVLHHGSLLYQPLLFLMLGPFLPILALIALYAWAMTWPRPSAA